MQLRNEVGRSSDKGSINALVGGNEASQEEGAGRTHACTSCRGRFGNKMMRGRRLVTRVEVLTSGRHRLRRFITDGVERRLCGGPI